MYGPIVRNGRGGPWVFPWLLPSKKNRCKSVEEAIERLGGEGRICEIAELVDRSVRTTRTEIEKLMRKGIVKRVSRGRYSLVRDNDE
jgi:DeoR/GlpR family transcriptional regulator of sugar metabolism